MPEEMVCGFFSGVVFCVKELGFSTYGFGIVKII